MIKMKKTKKIIKIKITHMIKKMRTETTTIIIIMKKRKMKNSKRRNNYKKKKRMKMNARK